jgi:hypothetical protein
METFPMAPVTTRALWLFLPIGLLLVGVAVMLTLVALGPSRARYELSSDGLLLRGDIYGRRPIATADLRGGAARIVDLDRESDLRPALRTFGTALPGYRSGWFRLRNGDKALVSLSDPHRVVYVPTTQGYVLLLSPSQPDHFLEALRKVAPAT